MVQALTVEEAKERRERMAKMRSLLFAHEQKAKRLKAIKSKGFHRHAKKAAKMKASHCVPCTNKILQKQDVSLLYTAVNLWMYAASEALENLLPILLCW